MSPCQFLFARFSFVSIAFICTSHIKTLIFKGILVFQSFLLGFSVYALQRCAYIDLTENFLFVSHIQLGLSLSSPSAHVIRVSLSYLTWFCAVSSSHLLKLSLHPLVAISATLPVCSLQISNRCLNFSFSVTDPHQGSLQKSVSDPFPTLIYLPQR